MDKNDRQVRLYRSGPDQTLRIPSELELDADEVVLRKEGDCLIVEPVRKRRLFPMLRKLGCFDEPSPASDESGPP